MLIFTKCQIYFTQFHSRRNLSLKPIQLEFIGTGSPVGNEPSAKAERIFSQNLVYLCKDKPKSAKELSEELCVPMPYIEEELEIQCHGENGHYGLLKKLENGKYITNILLVDYQEYDESNKILEHYLPEYCMRLKKNIEKHQKTLLSFPYLSKQTDSGFILWSLINSTVWNFIDQIIDLIQKKHFANVESANRKFTSVAIAYDPDTEPDFSFYGSDGIKATAVGGFKKVFVDNIYGKRIEKHFSCGHNISMDEKLLMVLRSIDGLSVNDLNESEKEVAAKAIECGYLRKNGELLEPKIIICNAGKDTENFYHLHFVNIIRPFSAKHCHTLSASMQSDY